MCNYPFSPMPSPDEMNRWDAASEAEAEISPALLMENAGKAALNALLAEFGSLQNKKILIFMGKGNNGGDGAVLARLALGEKAQVLVCHLHPLPEINIESLSGLSENYEIDKAGKPIKAAKLHLGLAIKAGVEFFHLTRAFSDFPKHDWEYPDIVVDALLGTGLNGGLRDEHIALIKRINLFRNSQFENCISECSHSIACSDAQWPGVVWPPSSPDSQTQAGNSTFFQNSKQQPFMLALDIPSGIDGLTGQPRPVAVSAHATITFEAPKPGLLSPEARPYLGKLLVAPVGIPKEVKQRYPAAQALLMPGCVTVTPDPYTFQHKNMAGKVLIVGGSHGMTGAPCLAALAAFRAGAGRVAVACPGGLDNQIKAALPDILTIPLGKGNNWEEEAALELTPLLKNWDAIVLGPGMGTGSGAVAVVAACLSGAGYKTNLGCEINGDGSSRAHAVGAGEMEYSASHRTGRVPVLADADALTIMANRQDLLSALTWRDLITPHPGEAARLLNLKSVTTPQMEFVSRAAQIQANRLQALKDLLRLTRAATVLKGPVTLVGQSERVAISPFIEPNLALAGSGDVLAGIGGAWLALGIPAFNVACAAVYLHGMGGHLLRENYPFRGNLPSEIAEIIPKARLALTSVHTDWVPDLCGLPGSFQGYK